MVLVLKKKKNIKVAKKKLKTIVVFNAQIKTRARNGTFAEREIKQNFWSVESGYAGVAGHV